MVFRLFLLMCVSLNAHAFNMYGYLENVRVNHRLSLNAKLDTGANSASIDAHSIKRYQVKGKPWIQFSVETKKGPVVFTSPLIGTVKIKVRSGELATGNFRDSIERPVVMLTVTLGNKSVPIQVNLADRENFLYPLLLGRKAIKTFDGVVNPALRFTSKPKA